MYESAWRVMLIMVAVCFLCANTFAYDTETITAPDGATVTITRDDYGVPHVTAENDVGIFFGQGYAVAQDKMFRMDWWRLAGEGRQAEAFGSHMVSIDIVARTEGYLLDERTEMFEGMNAEYQSILTNYTMGVNAWIDSIYADPETRMPIQYADFSLEYWSVEKSIAAMTWLARGFSAFGGSELERLGELQSFGQDWFDANRPINDPNAPVSIRGGEIVTREWRYSGMQVRQEVIDEITEARHQYYETLEEIGLPPYFGSYLVLIAPARSRDGYAMMLSAPEMNYLAINFPNAGCEIEMTTPDMHFSGLTVPGVPGVVVGRTDHHAWGLTSGKSDNIDIFIDSTETEAYDRYWFEGEWRDFESYNDTIHVLNGISVPISYYRTIHGPVIGADLEAHQVYAKKFAIWKRETAFMTVFLEMARADSVGEFENAMIDCPLVFNFFYADDSGFTKMWHVGAFHDRSLGLDPRLPRKGDGTEEWGDYLTLEELPQVDSDEQNWLVNWNNKPVVWWDNGDNVPWIGDHRVSDVIDIVEPVTNYTYEDLLDVDDLLQRCGSAEFVIEWSDSIRDGIRILPGQSDFINLDNEANPHLSDQWPLRLSYTYKDWIFGDELPVETQNSMPGQFSLKSVYPNPFNPDLSIVIQMHTQSHVQVRIFNILGKEVAVISESQLSTGIHRLVWHAADQASGVYFLKIEVADTQPVIRKVIMLH